MLEQREIGYIGLGKMGFNMVTRLVEHGVRVVGWDASSEATAKIASIGAQPAKDLNAVIDSLQPPRILWLMLPHGEPIDQTLEVFSKKLTRGDLIIEGGNSHYEDSIRRAKQMDALGLNFMDFGVSGGPSGAKNGAALMIGGSEQDYQRIEWLAKIVAAPDSYARVGPVGAGHFVKMVHNGIEYAFMEAIGEGFAVLKNGPFQLNLATVATAYRHNTVIASRLIDWTEQALLQDPNLTDISSIIGHTGEGEWTIQTAKNLGIDVPAIQDAFKVRVESKKDPENSPAGFRNKIVSALRGQFGHHSVKKS
ncbi:decarboxylating 6-phosphogluconate dehydrogenase [Patescibacteria group bacterium]|nr:decarboxylating 6-phosphogluconate dehydrogenase [Patescibacteria group bacterium]